MLNVYPDDLLAKEIFEVYEELGYTALALGDQDFSNGAEAALDYRRQLPFFSHNLAVCPDETSCVFYSTEPLIVEKGEVRLGLFALVDPQVFTLYPETLKDKLKVSSPQAVAENMVKTLHDQGIELIILLYHGPYEEAAALARAVDGIQVIVVGHEQRLIEAEKIGGSILVSPGEEGNRLGQLTLSLSKTGINGYVNSFKLFDYMKDRDDPSVRERINRYREELRARLKSKQS